jgi:hypothetical protein
MAIDNLNNVNIRIPEYIIFYALEAGFKYIQTDYESQSDKTKSLLYFYLSNVGIQRYQFFEQAVAVFVKAKDDPRKLTLDLMFNRAKETVPNIYISLPSEQPAQNTLGFGETDIQALFDDFDNNGENGAYRTSFTRRFATTYNLIITSDNDNEVVLIYHVLKALIMSLNVHFALAGLQNLKIGGSDLKSFGKEIAINGFARSLSMSFEYETSAVDFSKYPMINQLVFQGTGYLIGDTTTTTTTIAPATTTTTTAP